MTPPRTDGLRRPGSVRSAPVPEPIAVSLRTACDALRTSPDEVSSIAVVSHLPNDFVISGVMDFTERLAEAYGFRAHLFVHDGGLDVRFERQHPR